MASGTLHSITPVTVDSLLTTSQSVISKAKDLLNDAIFNQVTLFKRLNDKARVTRQGGASISFGY